MKNISKITKEVLSEGLIQKFEKFIGGKLKAGRMNIKGFPVDIEDNSDVDYIDMKVVDADAAKGLFNALKKAGFTVRKDGKTGLSVG